MEVRGSVPAGQAPTPRAYEGVWRSTVPAVDSAVPQVRHGVRTLLADLDVPLDDDVRCAVLLIVSELVTNAVRHAAVLSPEISIEVVVGAAWIRVAVEDNHPYRPKALETDHARTGGRGLLLVASVTDEAGGSWDVTPTATGGKVAWAALPLRTAPG
ncbi:ATP-binding protein [Actinacidiphila sp. ITFR-21]|uniref:ATP-binding protein n=1 Tax=Actinacidiphila sp. ITFR-21 TaxID=3075199 RepID=UPI00288933E1|nr:ATP-binding protein [Streptomyces sp. ITFR-21]WNI19856.1 ATP-binding protein [Streptomyces sp. ITFR-21]